MPRFLRPTLLVLFGLLLLAGGPVIADEEDDATAARNVAVLLAQDTGLDVVRIWGLSDSLAKGGKASIKALRQASAGADAPQRLAIGRALVLLEDYTQGLALLRGVVLDADAGVAVKVAAIDVLAADGEIEESEWLEEQIDVTYEPRTKMAMAKALWRLNFRNKRKGKEVLLQYLRSTDLDLRADGALALGEIGAVSEAKPVLVKLRSEPTERGRSATLLLRIFELQQQADQALRGSGSPDGDEVPAASPAAGEKGRWPLLDEIYEVLENLYLHSDELDRKKIEDAMASGITAALDPFTQYLTEEANAKFREGLDPTYGGVGAYVYNDPNNQDRFTISRPIWGGPIYRAGLRTGDMIFEIDGTSTAGLTVDDCVRLLKGMPGSDVTITVFRPGWTDTRPFTLKRARITIPTTAYDILPGRIGFLEILSFSQDTAAEVGKVLDLFDAEGVEAIVVDLRYNGGGYLQSAVEIASQFLPAGKLVVSEKGRAGAMQERKHPSLGTGSARRQVPVVLLINQGTASAAEILAGALQHWDRARLVGTMSFGKGSVQRPWDIRSRPGEPFTDALRDVPVSYSDLNGNGRRDPGEGVRTRLLKNMRYDPPEKYVDANGSGAWDPGEEFTDENLNGTWDAGEEFEDKNGNGIWDPGGLLKLTIHGYYLPDGRNLRRDRKVVNGKVVTTGGLTPDVDAEQAAIDYWELQAQRTLDGSEELRAYADDLYANHRQLAERLARSDSSDPSLYPDFDEFYEKVDTPLSKEGVRFIVRYNLRRRIGDDLGRALVGDVVDDPMLQAAILDVFKTLDRDVGEVEGLEFLATSEDEETIESE